jgi:hypothetical protein
MTQAELVAKIRRQARECDMYGSVVNQYLSRCARELDELADRVEREGVEPRIQPSRGPAFDLENV